MVSIEVLDIIQHLIYGIVAGSMYVLMAVGFSLIWGIMDMLNFAHGEFYMLGGYFTYYCFTLFHINPFLSVFMAMALIFFIGAGIFNLGMHSLSKKPHWHINAIIFTLGVGISIQNIALLCFGGRYKGIPCFFDSNVKLWGAVIGVDRLMVLIVGLILIIALLWFVKRTTVGLSMQAIAQNTNAARLMGINIKRIYTITFGVSVALAAAAGGLLAPIYFIYPTVGHTPLLMAFAVVILGGLGNVKGAIYAGFLVGVIESFTILFLSSEVKDLVIFSLVIVLLTLRPTGLFGLKQM
jgi:branched-chain amino acid transport system permease protein